MCCPQRPERSTYPNRQSGRLSRTFALPSPITSTLRPITRPETERRRTSLLLAPPQPLDDRLAAQHKLFQALHHAQPLPPKVLDRRGDKVLRVVVEPVRIDAAFALVAERLSRRRGSSPWPSTRRRRRTDPRPSSAASSSCRWWRVPDARFRRFSMSMTLSTVQNAPVRPHPAEQCTSMGRTWSPGSGRSCHDRGGDAVSRKLPYAAPRPLSRARFPLPPLSDTWSRGDGRRKFERQRSALHGVCQLDQREEVSGLRRCAKVRPRRVVQLCNLADGQERVGGRDWRANMRTTTYGVSPAMPCAGGGCCARPMSAGVGLPNGSAPVVVLARRRPPSSCETADETDPLRGDGSTGGPGITTA